MVNMKQTIVHITKKVFHSLLWSTLWFTLMINPLIHPCNLQSNPLLCSTPSPTLPHHLLLERDDHIDAAKNGWKLVGGTSSLPGAVLRSARVVTQPGKINWLTDSSSSYNYCHLFVSLFVCLFVCEYTLLPTWQEVFVGFITCLLLHTLFLHLFQPLSCFTITSPLYLTTLLYFAPIRRRKLFISQYELWDKRWVYCEFVTEGNMWIYSCQSSNTYLWNPFEWLGQMGFWWVFTHA